MESFNIIISIISAASIPSIVCGLLFTRIEKNANRREHAQKQQTILLVKGVRTSIALGEATSIALRDGKTNGETKSALSLAKDVKSDIDSFYLANGVEHLT